MDSQPGPSGPWPLFVALGAAATEVGVLFGLVPVAVGGVLLFGGSCAGIARDAGYADTVWRPLRAVGVVIGAAAALVWALRAPALTIQALATAASTDPFAVRAAVVLSAAGVLVVAGVVAPILVARR